MAVPFFNPYKGSFGRFFAGDPTFLGYWQLDGSSIDNSGNGNNGLDGAVTYSPAYGKFSQGANFNGTSSVISLSSVPLTGTGNWTLNAWIKTSVTGTRKGVFAFGGGAANSGVNMFINISNHHEFDLSQVAGPAGSINICDGNWHMLTATNSGGTISIYTDGVFEASSTMSPNITTGNKYIGEDLSPAVMNGSIDEVAVLSRALSAQEISQYHLWTMVERKTLKGWLATMNAILVALSASIMNGASRTSSVGRTVSYKRSMTDSILRGASRNTTLAAMKVYVRTLTASVLRGASRTVSFVANLPLWGRQPKSADINFTTQNKSSDSFTLQNKSSDTKNINSN